MPKVFCAQPYSKFKLGSSGKAAYMLLRQYDFPDTYLKRERHILADHDRCLQLDRDHGMECFRRHTRSGEFGLEAWLKDAKDEQVMAFLKDILKADAEIQWTGYRITGSVDRGNGYPVWTLELFAKDPRSNTKVYAGEDAPNVSHSATVATGSTW